MTDLTFTLSITPTQVFTSVMIAVAYGIINYFLSNKQTSEPFSFKVFTKTVLIGVFVGAVISVWGVDPQTGYAQAFQYVTGNTFFMTLIDDWVNKLFSLTPVQQSAAKTVTG